MANKISSELIQELNGITGKDWVVADLSQMQSYLYDETETKIRPVASEECVVVKPGTAEEVSEIVKLANRYLVPLVPRGGGTGLCGAAIPTSSSIVLSLERLNKLVEYDTRSIKPTLASRVTLEGLLEILKDHDKVFFPVHPGVRVIRFYFSLKILFYLFF